jgi:hypothetical protein
LLFGTISATPSNVITRVARIEISSTTPYTPEPDGQHGAQGRQRVPRHSR